jgi:hypothetical protein
VRIPIAALLFPACWTAAPPPPPVRPPPVAEPAHAMSGAQFRALLDREDWTDLIDPDGVVSFDVGYTDALHARCGRRAALIAKFEALNLVAEALSEKIAKNTQETTAPTCRSLERDVVECHVEGAPTHFRFAWRDGKFMLNGIARFSGAAMSSDDVARYAVALRGRRCDPIAQPDPDPLLP